jgi:DNA-binding NtrC family response regulator
MTAFGQIDQAVALMRAGARDYLTKPFKVEDLLLRARGLVDRKWTSRQSLLGVSPAMRQIEGLLQRIGRRRSPVLFTGETGVGKGICARLLHSQSASPDQPFVAVNCAAIPDNLLESELFGHEKGGFTGATGRHLGYAERARRGTLFLDEVGELPAALQAKLLRLVEDSKFHRVGGEAAIALNARIVCASNRDLLAEVRAGRFREDLLYRINVVAIEVPPLRERAEDIQWFLEHFFADVAREPDTTFRGISALAEEAALAHLWPGNIRDSVNKAGAVQSSTEAALLGRDTRDLGLPLR